MSWVVAGVTAAVTVGSGIASSRASAKAADKAAEGGERSAAQVQAAADQARGDVLDFFPSAQKDLLAGAGAAGDLLTGGTTEQQRLLSGGNLAAQSTLSQGFDAQKSALLGTQAPTFAPHQPSQAPQAPKTPEERQAQLEQFSQMSPEQLEFMRFLGEGANPEFIEAVRAQQPQVNAFAPKGVGLSQPIQNPLQEGLFSDVGRVLPEKAKELTANISSNSDTLRLIQSGDIDIPGLDTGFLTQLDTEESRAEGGFLSRNSIMNAVNTGNIDFFKDSGLNEENQATMRLLISGLIKIRGA
jgi:hypothetical protein